MIVVEGEGVDEVVQDGWGDGVWSRLERIGGSASSGVVFRGDRIGDEEQEIGRAECEAESEAVLSWRSKEWMDAESAQSTSKASRSRARPELTRDGMAGLLSFFVVVSFRQKKEEISGGKAISPENQRRRAKAQKGSASDKLKIDSILRQSTRTTILPHAQTVLPESSDRCTADLGSRLFILPPRPSGLASGGRVDRERERWSWIYGSA